MPCLPDYETLEQHVRIKRRKEFSFGLKGFVGTLILPEKFQCSYSWPSSKTKIFFMHLSVQPSASHAIGVWHYQKPLAKKEAFVLTPKREDC